MSAEALIDKVNEFFLLGGLGDGTHPTGIDDLIVLRSLDKTAPDGVLYDPSVCVVLQGAKEVEAGSRSLHVTAGQSVLISHVSPVVSRVVEATRNKPYIALVLGLDLEILRSLAKELSEAQYETARGPAITAGESDKALVEQCLRLFELRDDPVDLKIVGPLIRREIHYRLLVSPNGGVLRELLKSRSNASQIARVMAHLRQNYSARFTVAELADMAGMSVSSFHEHFKALTGLTPLQFHKELRLLEARSLLHSSSQSISMIAFSVGYESANHFSRDFTRKFGRTPSEERRAWA